MVRLLLHVEGETEETFVKAVLREHLALKGYHSVEPRLMGPARLRSQRGGICSWQRVLKDVLRHLKEDSRRTVGTMVDYYGLPARGRGAWPGRLEASKIVGTPEDKAGTVERAVADSVAKAMGSSFNRRRFVPYVMMHEFEAMLFSDCSAFGLAIGRTDLTASLEQVRLAFDTPEDIDDGRTTAPSKRILQLLPSYQKELMGNLGVLEIGFEAIRCECPHFNHWIECLEGLGEG